MAIVQKRTPPANGSDAIGRALRDLAGPPDPKDTLGGAAIDLSKPLPVYRLGLDAIRQAGPDSLKQATRVGWRYLLERGERAGYADVKESAGGQARFSSVSRSRNADRLIAAAHVAQRIGEQLPDECEARILDVPALYTAAMWLTCSPPVFIPYLHPERLEDRPESIEADPRFLDELVARARHTATELPPRREPQTEL